MRQWIARIRSDFADVGKARTPRAWLAAVVRAATTEHSRPGQLGLAVLVGVTVGMTPFFGLHLLICLGLAWLLRLNKVLVYAAANISVPPMIPVIAVACVQTGYLIAHGKLAALDAASLDRLKHAFFGYWLGGAVVNGAVVGGALGALVWGVSRRRQAKADAVAAATERLFQAFAPAGELKARILRGKVHGDPAYRAVLAQCPAARTLLDLGGGEGSLALLFALTRPGARATVVDWDEARLARGRRAAARLGVPVAFVHGDVFAAPDLPEAEIVALIDVLHYQPLERQQALLAAVTAGLKPEASLIIRDMDADLRARTVATVAQERFSLLIKRTLATAIVPRPGKDLVAQLEGAGMTVERRPCYGWTPFANCLWVGRRGSP